MKKSSKPRRKFRPTGERLDLRLAPLNMMDLGIGALILSDVAISERSTVNQGIDESRQTSSSTNEWAMARTEQFPVPQVGTQHRESARNATDGNSVQSNTNAARPYASSGITNPVDLADDDFFNQLTIYEELTKLNAVVNDRITDHGTLLETGSRSADLRFAGTANSAKPADVRQPSPRGNDRDNREGTNQTGKPIGRDGLPQLTIPSKPISPQGLAKPQSISFPENSTPLPAPVPLNPPGRLERPNAENISPYYRLEPISSETFLGEFFVELKPGVSSPALAAQHGFTHEFTFEGRSRNLHVWKIDESKQVRSATQFAATTPEAKAKSLLRDRNIVDAYPVIKREVPVVSIPSGGELQLAGPEANIIAPFQKVESAAGVVFNGQFVVQLAQNAISTEVAADHGAVHDFSYPHLANINLWNIPEGVEPVDFAARLSDDPRIVEAYPAYSHPLAPMSLLNDPMLPAQWHLYNQTVPGLTTGQTGSTGNIDSNVEAAWDLGMTGKGVTVSVVDDGLEYTHPDLSAHNVDAAGWNFLTPESDDPMPTVAGDGHGTSVAGVTGAVGNNGIGGSGVAPDALLAGSRLIASTGSTDQQKADALNWSTTRAAAGRGGFDASLIDVYNNSWGYLSPGQLRAFGPASQSAISNSAVNGRGGLGSIYLFAAGNARVSQDNTNYQGTSNNRHVITVAAVQDNGTFASYSSPGANILVSGLSNGGFNSIVTTDRAGSSNGYSFTDYNDTFGGTSSATPFVSGVVAQMLQANPNLTWRDVQHILVRSATRNDPASADWDANPTLGGVQRNSGGHFVNHNYGFGLVDALGAVNLATNWRTVGPELVVDTGTISAINDAIPDNNTTGITKSFNVTPDIRIERVELVFTATHAARGDLEVTLTSPSGTVSRLAESRGNSSVVSDVGNTATSFKTALPHDANGPTGVRGQTIQFTSGALNGQSRNVTSTGFDTTTKFVTVSPAFSATPAPGDTFVILGSNYAAWPFSTVRHWDETSAGNWSITVKDRVGGGVTGTWGSYQLRFYGTEIEADTTGPRVTGIISPNANGMVNGGSVSSFRIQFDELINKNTLTTADVSLTRVGSGTVVTPSSIVSVDEGTCSGNPCASVFDITLPSAQSTVGNYRVDVGPDIADVNGNLLNQDGDLSNGEATQDKYTEFFTLASQFIYANTTSASIPDVSSTTVGIPSVPALNIADLNVLMKLTHVYAGCDIEVDLQKPGGAFGKIADDSTNDCLNGSTNNGFLNTVLDDEAASQFGVSDNYYFTGSYRPNNTALTSFEGSTTAGTWNLRARDVASADTGMVRYFSLIITPAAIPNISINSVTNTDAAGDRNFVEVAYTISNTTAPSFELGVYSSTDAFFNFNSDTPTLTTNSSVAADAGNTTTQFKTALTNLISNVYNGLQLQFTSGVNNGLSRTITGYDASSKVLTVNAFPNAPSANDTFTLKFLVTDTNCVAAANCLAIGTDVVKLNAGLFPDPSFTSNQPLHSLVIADPFRNVVETSKFDNYGVLEGVTQTPDGSLYIAGRPFNQIDLGSVVTDASNSTTQFKTDLPQTVAGYHVGSTLVFTSGANAGLARTISGYNSATKIVTLSSALPSTPAVTSTFEIGKPSGNSITITNSDVTWNGTAIGYTAANVNDIFVTGSTEDDVIIATGVNENVLAFLGVGDDTYTGGNLIDAVQGGPGNDTLTGNDGNDRLYGMMGNDTVDGGAGADTVSVGPGGLGGQTQVLSGGTGNDYLLIDGTSKNDRMTIWDPDGDLDEVGTSLNARVSSLIGDVESGPVVNGPDGHGYVARKTMFQEIDLVPGAGVTTVLNSGSINAVDDIDLGANEFNFYGTVHTGANKLFVNDNGLIMFGSGVTNFDNFDLNSIFFITPRPLIAPFFDSLRTDTGGSGPTDSMVLAKIENGQLTIEWSNVPHETAGGAATFQAILELNTGSTPGDITFNYPDVDFGNISFDDGKSASIGIQNSNGSSVLAANQLAFNGIGPASTTLTDGTAFTFSIDNGFNAAYVQDIAINAVDSADVLLVNASHGDDWIELSNSAVPNSTVGLNAVLIGGPGDDTIFDGLGVDSLFGDSGYSTFPGDGVDSLHSTDTRGGDRLIGPDAADGYFSSTGFGSFTGSGVGVDDVRVIQEAIADNSHTNTSATNFYRELKSDGTLDNDWSTSTTAPNYLGDFRFHTTTGPSGGSDHVTNSEWVMTNTGPGWYQFFATWNASASRAHNAPYTIVDRGSGKVSGAGISTTVFNTDLPQTINDLYVGATLTFTSGANLGQSRVISDYDGTNRRVTLGSALTNVPSSNDTFTVSIDRITIAVDQAVAPNDESFGGVSWEKLLVSDGTRNLATSFPILFGSSVVKLSNAADNVHVIADAVRRQAVAEWFVDNSDTQGASPFEYYTETGVSWTNGVTTGSYGTSARVVPIGDGSQTARWTLDKLVPGKYQVYATWTSTPTNPGTSQEDLFRASNVPYKVFDGAAQVGTQLVDQRFLPSNDPNADLDGTGRAWRSLGQFDIASGTLSVEVNNNATQNTSPTSVSADAIRVVLLEKDRFDP